MKKFISNGFLLAIPLLVYIITILIIDPYNYVSSFRLVDNEAKSSISWSVEPHLYKIRNFQNKPAPNIVLGDSRSQTLFRSINSPQWADLSYGGGSIKEMLQTFWWTVDKVELDTVLMGINLNLYNKYNKRFWVEEVLDINKNFFSYAFSQYTFRSAKLYMQSVLFNKELQLGRPDMEKDEFWQHQLDVTARKFYEQYGYPDSYYEELKEVKEYCEDRDIQLIFWVPPTHLDLQKKKHDYDLMDQDSVFTSDLRSLGEVYDYDYESEITVNMDDYGDPMHFNEIIGSTIFAEIITGRTHYARYSSGISTGQP